MSTEIQNVKKWYEINLNDPHELEEGLSFIMPFLENL